VCRNVPSTIILDIVSSGLVFRNSIVRVYEAELFQAIADGRLQEQLDIINPESPVTILRPPYDDSISGDDETALDDDIGGFGDDEGSNTDRLSPGAKAGIAAGAFLLVMVPLVLYLTRDRKDPKKEGKKELEADRIAKRDAGPRDDNSTNNPVTFSDGDAYVSTPPTGPSGVVLAAVAGGAIGAARANYGRSSRNQNAQRHEEDEDYLNDDLKDETHASSGSTEGDGDDDNEHGLLQKQDSLSVGDSSGWSSSEGISSLNTGSASGTRSGGAAGDAAAATMAAIGSANHPQHGDEQPENL